MQILKTVSDLRHWRHSLRMQEKTLSFVPTMGALHDGHLELVRQGLSLTDICLPYIFINPKQFGDGEDLNYYPKILSDDLEKLSLLGIETVYVPETKEIYPDKFQTMVSVSEISKPLEGRHRPNYFNGVTTIVCKMLLQCLPDIAIFGEKDFQQLKVIERMVIDLNIPVQINSVPTVRDKNGLALSSRNQYLTSKDYQTAVKLNKILLNVAKNNLDEDQAHVRLKQAGFDRIDYCTARNSNDFTTQNPDRVFAAVWIGTTRLIDNISIDK